MTNLDPRSLQALTDQMARGDLGVFVAGAFRELHDEPYLRNWHVEAIAHALMEVEKGTVRRQIITMPPRTMKSFIASICLPAWLLGRNPAEKIICASYAQDLSNDFSFQMRKLMQSEWYCRVFPRTRLDPRKQSTDDIRTTRGGYRFSTSTGGTLTGRGASFIIIDDPIKAKDAHSEVVRENALRWYSGTVASRLNNQRTGRIVVVAQRLHLEDLPGQLMAMGGWQELSLPLVAHQDQQIEVSRDVYCFRSAGCILHEARFSNEDIARLRLELGEQDFEAQYNQRPLPPGGALFKLQWLQRYEERPKDYQVEAIVQSWDTAYEVHEGNDYSVCTTWALSGKRYYLLNVLRARLQFHELEKAVYGQREKWNADVVILERAGSGISLFQNINNRDRQLWCHNIGPQGTKLDRASQQSPKFERGEVFVPVDAPWLQVFLDELASFPHCKHDDQVDSAVQFLTAVDTGNLPRAAYTARHYQR